MSRTLEQRPYGSTGKSVTVVGLGGAALAGHSLGEGVTTVHRALELGINYFDTAPAYGHGASQVVMGTALAGRSEPYMLATKLGYMATPSAYRSLEALRAQLWENLRALRRDRVDVLQVHLVERACWWEDVESDRELLDVDKSYDFANAPVMQVLREAKEQGICRYIGITADRADELARVLKHVDVDTCMPAYRYSLLARRAREVVMPLARENGVAFIAAAVLKPYLIETRPEWQSHPLGGVAPELGERLRRLYRLGEESGLSLVTLGVRYLLSDPHICTILIGTGSRTHLEESVEAARAGPLPPDLHQAAEALGVP